MHEVHSPGIHRDMRSTERSDGGCRGIEPHEMHIDIAVVFESGGDTEAGGERAAEAVNKDIDALPLVLGEGRVNGLAVEVRASNVAFKRDVVCGFRHGVIVLRHEDTAI